MPFGVNLMCPGQHRAARELQAKLYPYLLTAVQATACAFDLTHFHGAFGPGLLAEEASYVISEKKSTKARSSSKSGIAKTGP